MTTSQAARLTILPEPTPLVLSAEIYPSDPWFTKTRNYAAEVLAPVITIMNERQLTAYGFQVTIEQGVRFDDRGTPEPAVTEKLFIARDLIRPDDPSAAAGLPNAVIIFQGAGIGLFGEDAPRAVIWQDRQALCYEPGHTLVTVTREDCEAARPPESWGGWMPGRIGDRRVMFGADLGDRTSIMYLVAGQGLAVAVADSRYIVDAPVGRRQP